MDDYGFRYDQRFNHKDALDHVKQRWNPYKELSKRIYKPIEMKLNEKVLPLHVKYHIFWEYYYLNKGIEYRSYSLSYWQSIYKNKDKYRFGDVFAAYRPKGECQLRFEIKSITILNNVNETNPSGLRIVSSKPVLKIEFGECVDAAVNANTMSDVFRNWSDWKKREKRVYKF